MNKIQNREVFFLGLNTIIIGIMNFRILQLIGDS